jgi:pimeloyl-ACP methyl ester carboxylesterase
VAVISFCEGKIFGEVFGSKTSYLDADVIALHGWQRDRRDFKAVFENQDKITALCLDLPGFGLSPEPGANFNSRDYANLVFDIFRDFNHPVILLGHSFGGRVAAALGEVAKDRIRSIIIVATPLVAVNYKNAPFSYRIYRFLRKKNLISEARFLKIRNKYASNDYQKASLVMKKIMNTALEESKNGIYVKWLNSSNCPVRLIWGENDREIPVEIALKAKQELKNAQLEIIPDAGHLIPIETPYVLLNSCLELVNK